MSENEIRLMLFHLVLLFKLIEPWRENDDDDRCLNCGGGGFAPLGDDSANDGACWGCHGSGHTETPDEWDEKMRFGSTRRWL